MVRKQKPFDHIKRLFSIPDYEFVQLFSVIFLKYLPGKCLEKNFSLSVNGMFIDVSGRV